MLFFVTSVKFSYSSISDRNRNPTPVVTTISTSFKAWFSSAGLRPHRAGKHERNQKQRYAEKYNRRPGKKRKVSAIKRPVTLIKPPKKMDATMNPFILFATFFATEAGP
jgi:hypothetical protein